MEPLWSPVVATGGNRWQIGSRREGRNQAKTVATSCHRLPETFHGKQGVCHRLPPVAGGPPPCEGGGRHLFVTAGYFLLLQSGHGHWSQPQPVHASRIM